MSISLLNCVRWCGKRKDRANHNTIPPLTGITTTVATWNQRKKQLGVPNVSAEKLGPESENLRMLKWPTLFLVLGYLVTAARAQEYMISAHTSGEKCQANSPKQCLSQATCSPWQKCQCPVGTWGDGTFRCYTTKSIRAEVSGSKNRLMSFNNTCARVLWPCKFRFTEFQTFRRSNGCTCHFQVYGVNKVINGRIALAGMEVNFRVINDTRVPNGIGFRILGRAHENDFEYKVWSRDDFLHQPAQTVLDPPRDRSVDGSGSGDGYQMRDADDSEDYKDDFPWENSGKLDIGGGEEVTHKIDTDNFASITVADCGTDIRFRAPNINALQQNQSPGLSVAVRKEFGSVNFLNTWTYIAEDVNSNVLTEHARAKGLSLEQEILDRAMEFDESEGEDCSNTADTYKRYCTRDQKAAALRFCSFFLQNSALVFCLEQSADDISGLKAFRLCLWNSCSHSKSLCSVLKSLVGKAGCASLTSESFKQMTCV